MPPVLLASILLQYRKGISEDKLLQKMSWLGMALTRRGAVVTNDGGLPNESTLKLGLEHLNDYIVKKRNFYMPKVVGNDY